MERTLGVGELGKTHALYYENEVSTKHVRNDQDGRVWNEKVTRGIDIREKINDTMVTCRAHESGTYEYKSITFGCQGYKDYS